MAITKTHPIKSTLKAAIDYINSMLDPSVRSVNVVDTLRSHNAEYLFFRTDHHWTALGAYYAYVDFCRAKGIQPHTLDQFTERSSSPFLGSFYNAARYPAMKDNPDTVQTFIPMGTNSMTFTDTSGTEQNWSIITNVSQWSTNSKYNTFVGSDQPYAYAHNPAITDGSACVVIKDSYGNAFIPFLIDHYEHIYWIDFRYYRGTIPQLVKEKSINDVIFCVNIYHGSSTSAFGLFERILGS